MSDTFRDYSHTQRIPKAGGNAGASRSDGSFHYSIPSASSHGNAGANASRSRASSGNKAKSGSRGSVAKMQARASWSFLPPSHIAVPPQTHIPTATVPAPTADAADLLPAVRTAPVRVPRQNAARKSRNAPLRSGSCFLCFCSARPFWSSSAAAGQANLSFSIPQRIHSATASASTASPSRE